MSWPDLIKYLEFHDRRVVVNSQELLPYALNGSVSVTVHRPVKRFVFTERKGAVKFSSNGFNIISGVVHTILLERLSVDGPWPSI
jgi:hypothetical protein